MSVWKPLIVCNSAPEFPQECRFSDLVLLAQNLINDLIVLSTFLAVACFAYAGFLLITSGGSETKKNKAKDVALKVLWGYIWILVAWLLVYTITSALLKSGYSILGSPK